tara:strand:+ start:87403 stop:87600 length:198 start_codon:yes stop_codon:yes gene_type:complete
VVVLEPLWAASGIFEDQVAAIALDGGLFVCLFIFPCLRTCSPFFEYFGDLRHETIARNLLLAAYP